MKTLKYSWKFFQQSSFFEILIAVKACVLIRLVFRCVYCGWMVKDAYRRCNHIRARVCVCLFRTIESNRLDSMATVSGIGGGIHGGLLLNEWDSLKNEFSIKFDWFSINDCTIWGKRPHRLYSMVPNFGFRFNNLRVMTYKNSIEMSNGNAGIDTAAVHCSIWRHHRPSFMLTLNKQSGSCH